jgi:immune inhibitor A
VISHEYGHSLGLPDFYSLGGRETYGDWNLMATDKSQNMDVFARQEMGWIVPEVLAPGETRTVTGMTDSKEDTHAISWQQPDGTPYTLQGPRVHNAQSFVAKLPNRQLIDPAKFDTGDGASLSHAWWSGSGNDFGCTPQKGHNLDVAIPGLADLPEDSTISLEMKSLWDIEWDYDYGFVMTSTDGGETYTSHASENGYTTATFNPNQNSCQGTYGNGLTGSSGSYQDGTQEVDRLAGNYPSSVFLADEFDISDLAGSDEGVLRFSYATDPGLARPGWFIDDLKVTATTPGGDEILLETDLEGEGGPDDPRFFNGGCKASTATAPICTAGWNYVSATAGSPADHAYYLEMRDRSGFDVDGRGQNDRDPIAFAPGLSLAYTDEAHGYGNAGTDDPPAQSPLDSQPDPGNEAPDLSDAAWTAAAGDSSFSDSGVGHTDNYTNPGEQTTDPRYPAVENPWRFQFDCLGFDVQSMSGDDVGPGESDGNLTGTVEFTMGEGCAEFNYGYEDDPGGDENTKPTARATADPTVQNVGKKFIFDGTTSTDEETPNDLDYVWDFDDGGVVKDAVGQRVRHEFAEPGVYDVTLTVTDPRGRRDTDTVQVTATRNVQCVQDVIAKQGGWAQRHNAPSAENGHYCDNAPGGRQGDTLRLRFRGPRADLHYGRGEGGGRAALIVDGQRVGTADFSGPRDRPQFGVVERVRNLGAGRHTIVLRVLAPSGGGGSLAFVDSFQVAGQTLAPVG